MLFFHLLLINYFTNNSLNIQHRLSFKGLLAYDPKYFQSPLTTLNTCFLKKFIADHRFNLREKILCDSLKLLKTEAIQYVEQSEVKSLSYNLFYFKIHLGSDYFHPIFRDLRRMNAKIYTFNRIQIGGVRAVVNKNDHVECQKF